MPLTVINIQAAMLSWRRHESIWRKHELAATLPGIVIQLDTRMLTYVYKGPLYGVQVSVI